MKDQFTAVMISCKARETERNRTLGLLAETDWPTDVLVSLEGAHLPTPQERQTFNALNALKIGVDTGKRFILFLEDDLEFNRHIFHNITHWEALERVTMASLYNPNIRERLRCDALHWFIADPDAIYGSQAYLFSRLCAKHIIEHWDEVVGMQDIKCSRIAAKYQPIYYFTPSLVQHVGRASTFGGNFHYTEDFDQQFKL